MVNAPLTAAALRCGNDAHSPHCGLRAVMTKPSENPALSGLVALSNRTGADIRPTLLRVMTDLYLQKPAHTAEEEAEYTRMALKLIDHVDGKTRSMIAGKIAGYPNAPAAVRQRLLKDHIV